MGCLENIERIKFDAPLVKRLTELYRYSGKDYFYEEVLKKYNTSILNKTLENDIIYASKMLDITVSPTRTKAIIERDDTPKNDSERIMSNIKNVLKLIQQKGTDIELTDNEFLSLGTKIFGDTEKFNFEVEIRNEPHGILSERKQYSKREYLAEKLRTYKKFLFDRKIEATQLITNFYIDIANEKIFNKHNDFMAIMIAYCLFCRERFNVFKYVSFFKEFTNKIEDFKAAKSVADYDWKNGYSDTSKLNIYFIELMMSGYDSIEKMARDVDIDRAMKKVDSIQSAILKLPQNFTLQNVKDACPGVSLSTIQRALKSLKDDGKIAPNGTGRSATWNKIVENEIFNSNILQTNIFEFIDDKK